MNTITELQEHLRITCPKCKCSLIPSKHVDIYSGNAIYCSNCGSEVTKVVYGKNHNKNKMTP